MSFSEKKRFSARVNDVRKVLNTLKAIKIKDKASFYVSEKGIKIIVEEHCSLQAIAFLQAELFEKYEAYGTIEFGVSLNILIECLQIYVSSPGLNSAPALNMSLEEVGSPIQIELMDRDIFTTCCIKTEEPETLEEFESKNETIYNKAIFKAEGLRLTLGELDTTSDFLEVTMSPEYPHFRITTCGISGVYHIDYPKKCEIMESFQCKKKQSQKYKLSLINASFKVLGLASKVSIRINKRGFLSVHFLLDHDGKISYVEYLYSPEIDDELESHSDSKSFK